MAVENKYINADLANDKIGAAVFTAGDKTVVMVATFEVAVADDDLSVFRLWKSVNPELIPVRIEVYNDAMTSSSDWDLGFYETTVPGTTGAVIDKDKLANTMDLSSGNGRSSPIDGLENLNISEVNERIWELAGQTITTKKRGYDIALTANTVGSAIGTVSVIAWFVQG